MTGATADPEMVELRVLRWVSEGTVSNGDGGYLYHGRMLTGDMAAALARLLLGGYIAAGQPGPDRRRAVSITTAGAARRATLEQASKRRD